jgi:malate dehydrogenase (oxaloacetate-decarboxylating)(NADP+)
VDHEETRKMRRAAELVREQRPDLVVEGEMQADTALIPEFMKEHFPFSQLDGRANILIFPNLAAGNIAFKIAQCMGASVVLGPILVGLAQPVALMTRYAEPSHLVQSAAIVSMLASHWEEK